MKQLISILTTIAFAALSSCAVPSPKRAYVFNRLNGEGEQVLDETIKEMETRSNEDFLTSADSHMTVVVTWSNKLPNTILGQARPYPMHCLITMHTDMMPEKGFYTKDDLALVLMHKIGHCFGLMHTEGEDDVMYYAYSYPQNREDSVTKFIEMLKRIRGVK